MKKSVLNSKVKAFTLTELLIVLAIIGILVLLALPRLMPLISRANSTEAQLQLGYLHTLQEGYYFTHSKYADNLEVIGFEQKKLVTDGGSAKYRIEMVEVSPTGYKARATAVVDFDKDGTFNIWEIDQDKNLIEVQKD